MARLPIATKSAPKHFPPASLIICRKAVSFNTKPHIVSDPYFGIPRDRAVIDEEWQDAEGSEQKAPGRLKMPIYEPERGVIDEDDVVDAADVKVPYVPDNIRQEIFEKFKANPVDNMFIKLAQEYRMTVIRCKAVIYLMKTRENMKKKLRVDEINDDWKAIYQKAQTAKDREEEIKKLKLRLKEEADMSKTKKKQLLRKKLIAEKIEQQRIENSMTAEQIAIQEEAFEEEEQRKWEQVYGYMFKTRPEKYFNVEKRIAELEAFPVCNNDTLSAEYGLPIAEIVDIISRMHEHTIRSTNLANANADFEQTMEELREMGVDTTFAETSSATDERFDSKYHPRLLGDDDYDAEMKLQRANLILRTRARYDPLTKDVMTKRRDDTSIIGSDPVENRAGVKTDGFMKSKFAVIDTSNSSTMDGATVIHTRDGKRRPANPLEEYNRSWSGKHPHYLEIALHEEFMTRHLDPDKDDEKSRKILEERKLEKVKILKEFGKVADKKKKKKA